MSATISAKDVMTLRQRTGMGMMECKAALNEAGGDMDQAVEILRAAAAGKMDERSDREATEGAIAIATDDAGSGGGVMVELNSETDFTAKNDAFIETTDAVAQLALASPAGEVASTDAITAAIEPVRLTTKENISFARGIKVEGQVGTYLHHNRKLGALIVVTGDGFDAELLTGLAQHVATSDGLVRPEPLGVDESSLDPDAVAAQKAAFIKEAEETGKPAEIAEKMSTGKMKKWIGEVTLLGQPYVKDMTGKTTVADALPDGATIVAYHRYAIG